MRYPTVLFDLDGTLIDSGEIILSSFRYATRTVLAREIPDDVLAGAIGGSNIHEQMRAFDEGRAEELVRVYREHNEPLHDELVAFEGIELVLERLAAGGRKLGIVTAKRRRTVDLAFAILPLERWFDAVVTSEQTEHHKPHPEPVLLALELLESAPAEAAFVGDSPFDMGAGKAAGVFTVGVSWGKIHSAELLRESGADAVVHAPEELFDVL
ncbi:MAG TPA: HAD-IA family hydrolase [Gaiellaceae bacterium]|nr:HAD-IA family hydrolase [Gaiellaceae bacterium]